MTAMIEVENLTKKYPGGVTAVEGIGFSVAPGEVVGVLGPNGAGKTTTMRILAGYLSPSGGEVRVNGLDVTRDSLEARRRMGYLPETCPLYTDMRVREYLHYRAALKGLSRRHRRSGVERVMEQCGLTGVRGRLIGHLSKGFRQRVGIADALVHNPDLLILDEPTIGLDPQQIVQIRNLIRELSVSHTILISSHILSEIEATCGRVLVLHRGRIVESATLGELEERWFRGCEVRVEARAVAEELDRGLRGLPDLQRLQVQQEGEWAVATLRFSSHADPREEVYARLRSADWPVRELHLRRHSLEEAFMHMTAGDR